MDAKPQNAALAALIQRNDAARQALAEQLQTLRHRMDLPARLNENIRNNRTLWFAGSTAVGLLVSCIFRKKSPPPAAAPRPRKGLIGLALTTAITLAKPALKTWLWNEAQKRILPRGTPRPR